MDKASSQNCINPYVLLCKTHTPQHTCLEIKISSSNLLQSEKESHLVRGRVKSVSGFQKLLASPIPNSGMGIQRDGTQKKSQG